MYPFCWLPLGDAMPNINFIVSQGLSYTEMEKKVIHIGEALPLSLSKYPRHKAKSVHTVSSYVYSIIRNIFFVTFHILSPMKLFLLPGKNVHFVLGLMVFRNFDPKANRDSTKNTISNK